MSTGTLAFELATILTPQNTPTAGIAEALAGFRQCGYKLVVYNETSADPNWPATLAALGLTFDQAYNGRPAGVTLHIDKSTFRFADDWRKDEFRVYAILATPQRVSAGVRLCAGWDADRFHIGIRGRFLGDPDIFVLSLSAEEWNAIKRQAKEGMESDFATITESFTHVKLGEP